MAVLIVSTVFFLAYFRSFANSAYCDINKIPFPGLKKESRLYLPGESFIPNCLKGYKVSKQGEILTCKDGVWTGYFPPCVAENCVRPPPFIQHGKLKSFTGRHSSKAEYECDKFYFLTGESSVTCYFGDWTGTRPVCKDSRCYFADLKKKEGVLAPNSNFTFSGENLHFKCAPGFASIEVVPLCSKGSWVEFGLPPCRESDCTVSDIRDGALMKVEERQVFKWKKLRHEEKTVFKKAKKGSHVPAGHKFQLVCDSKHSFQGKGLKDITTVCSKGMWVPNPVCLPTVRG